MNHKYWIRVAGLATLATVTAFGAQAADFEFSETPDDGSAVARIYVQGVGFSNVLDDNDTCGAGGGEEYCATVGGFGAYFGGLARLDGGAGLFADATIDVHAQSDSGGDVEEPAIYGGVGLHYISAGPDPWGVFGMAAAARGHGDADSSGPALGVGVEKRFGNTYFQFGHLATLNNIVDGDEYSGFKNSTFLAAGADFNVGSGVLSVGGILSENEQHEDGDGDFNFDWWQLSLDYYAPLGNGNLNWFAGLQIDSADDNNADTEHDRAIATAVKVGIEIPIGGAKSPFKTPNFRAPMSYSPEM